MGWATVLGEAFKKGEDFSTLLKLGKFLNPVQTGRTFIHFQTFRKNSQILLKLGGILYFLKIESNSLKLGRLFNTFKTDKASQHFQKWGDFSTLLKVGRLFNTFKTETVSQHF